MKNFDEPEGAAPGGELPAKLPRVELVGDPERITERFRQAGLTTAGATEQLRKSLQLESAEWRKQLQELVDGTSLES